MRHAAEATLKESVGPGEWVLHDSLRFESVNGDYLGGLKVGDTVYAVDLIAHSEHRIVYVYDGVGFFIDHDEKEFLPRLKVATLGFYATRQEAIDANRELLDE
jgi:hypothetical protein